MRIYQRCIHFFLAARLDTVLFLIAAIAVTGCQQKVPSENVFQFEQWQGNVDLTLPTEVQAKQDAIIRLFRAIQDVNIENVAVQEPDIVFREDFDTFFEDTADFFRWEWDGPPDKDVFSVLLILRRDEPGLPEVKKQREYRVRRSGSKFVISRVEVK